MKAGTKLLIYSGCLVVAVAVLFFGGRWVWNAAKNTNAATAQTQTAPASGAPGQTTASQKPQGAAQSSTDAAAKPAGDTRVSGGAPATPASSAVATAGTQASGQIASGVTGYQTGGGAVPGNPGGVINLIGELNDGRSLDARTTPNSPALGFPPYQDTSPSKGRNYDFVLPGGYSVILGGTTVDYAGRRHDKVVMLALQGPLEVHTWIFDGFYSVTQNDQTRGDFCSRWKWHRDTNKMLTEVQPLPSWGNPACPGLS